MESNPGPLREGQKLNVCSNLVDVTALDANVFPVNHFPELESY